MSPMRRRAATEPGLGWAADNSRGGRPVNVFVGNVFVGNVFVGNEFVGRDREPAQLVLVSPPAAP
jgi:hypothetical protein